MFYKMAAAFDQGIFLLNLTSHLRASCGRVEEGDGLNFYSTAQVNSMWRRVEQKNSSFIPFFFFNKNKIGCFVENNHKFQYHTNLV